MYIYIYFMYIPIYISLLMLIYDDIELNSRSRSELTQFSTASSSSWCVHISSFFFDYMGKFTIIAHILFVVFPCAMKVYTFYFVDWLRKSNGLQLKNKLSLVWQYTHMEYIRCDYVSFLFLYIYRTCVRFNNPNL